MNDGVRLLPGHRTHLRILTVLALLASWWFTPVPGVSAAEFRLALPGYQFSFPRDHFSHDEYRTEWWYYTGHLRTQSGQAYGYQVTFFRSGLAAAQPNPSRWAAKNLYMAHFSIANVAERSFRYFERVNRGSLGQAGASEKELRVWMGDWQVTGTGTSQHLRAREGEYAVDLTLVSQKPPIIHGEDGVSQKGAGRGRASHYYSLSRLKTEGTLTLRGRAMPVAGLSWMDHEFGSTQLDPDQVGWDWFSLQLEDGTELMLYLIRKTDGSPDPHSAGTWVGTDARTLRLRRSDFSVKVLDRWKSPRNRGLYPMRWRLSVPRLGLDVTVAPVFPDQELDTARSTQVIYWEGAVSAEGTAQGRPVKGQGYVEMTGYAEPFRKKL